MSLSDDQLVALLAFIGAEESPSIARTARQLGLAQSQLRRALSALVEAEGALGLVTVEAGEPERLRLTARGRDWIGPSDAP